MTNEVIVSSPTYSLIRFNDEDESIKLSEEQFNMLDKILLDTQAKFVKINDRIINISSIKEINKKPGNTLDTRLIYDESGTNRVYRDWCSSDKKLSFKDYANRDIKRLIDSIN